MSCLVLLLVHEIKDTVLEPSSILIHGSDRILPNQACIVHANENSLVVPYSETKGNDPTVSDLDITRYPQSLNFAPSPEPIVWFLY